LSAGSVRISREFFDDTAFKDEPFTEREAFMWLIFEASFKARDKRVGTVDLSLARGQVAASTRFMARAWTWQEPRVRRYLERLKNRRMVECVADAGVTVITLCNYDRYQSDSRVADAAKTQAPTRERRTIDANENKDEIRVEERGAYAPLARQDRFAEFWDTYPHRNGTKKAKGKASESYARAIRRGASEQVIIDGARAAHRHPDVIRGYARDPTSWLNQEGWADEISTVIPMEPHNAERRAAPASRSVQGTDAFLAGASRLPRSAS
jgi:hypothetical protein